MWQVLIATHPDLDLLISKQVQHTLKDQDPGITLVIR